MSYFTIHQHIPHILDLIESNFDLLHIIQLLLPNFQIPRKEKIRLLSAP